MKNLHVIGWLAPRYGGPATLLPEMSVALASRGNDVAVVTTNADGQNRLRVPIGTPVPWAGADVTFHSVSQPTAYLTSWTMLADLLRRAADFDVVHIHTLYRFHGIAAASVARFRHIPYVIQAHGSLDPWHRRRRQRAKDVYHYLVEDSIIRGASAVVCTSPHEEQSWRDLGYSVPIWVIPIGIDAQELRASSVSDFGATTGIDCNAQVVTFLGRISEKKGVQLLVESFRTVASEFPRAHLVIAGPDDEAIGRGLMPSITNAGLAGRVTFLGAVGGPGKRALLQRSDVFVLPSADESFGLAVAEAMAVGCPVIVSPEVAIEDIVRASGAGLVARRDPADIGRALKTILADPTAARAMSIAGRRAADEQFAWSSVAGELESMYEAVVANWRGSDRSIAAARPEPENSPSFMPGIVCPLCHGDLRVEDQLLMCRACGQSYPILDGIPVLLMDAALSQHDEMDHGHSIHGKGADPTRKAAQAMHFDRAVGEEFEIRRPHGTPRLYQFLLREKLKRAVRPIGPHLVGASALTVCGGSGMDAEFLARAGARVVATDISLGAARRTRERARRYGLDVTPIVADVEHLPFGEKAFDLVLVHDGLHHLEAPFVGLAEMARVARRWVSATEPAQAAATRVAVRMGFALEREAAGNSVARLRPDDVADALRIAGFRALTTERYAMYYPPTPGRVFQLLSGGATFSISKRGWRIGNALVGRFGNKMIVVAERR